MLKKLSILFLVVSIKAAQPLLYNWSDTTCGVPGGIPAPWPEYTNIVTMGADPTGVVACDSIINAAISGAPANSFIRIPAGRFRHNSQINISRSNVRLVGDSVTNSILEGHLASSAVSILVGTDSNPFPNSVLPTVVSGALSNTTSVTISDASTFSVGTLAEIRAFWPYTNEYMTVFGPNMTTVTTSSGNHNQNRISGMCQMVKIVGKSGNTLTVFPPFAGHFTNNAVMMWYNGLVTNVGIENITFAHRQADGTALDCFASMTMCQTIGCWVTNIEAYYSPRKGIVVTKSILGDICDSFFNISRANGPNGETVDLAARNTGMKVYNNRFYRCAPGICVGDADSGVVGPALMYNYFDASQATSDFTTSGQIGTDITFHGFGCFQILVQGNIGIRSQLDSYTGPTFYWTLFDNWFSGVHTNGYTTSRIPFAADRFSRYIYLGRNILGTNGITWDCKEMTGQTAATTKSILRFGYPFIGGNGYAVYFTANYPTIFWPGFVSASGYATNMLGALSGAAINTTNIPGTFILPSIIPATATYSAGGTYSVSVTSGATYNYHKGANEVTLINGANTYTVPTQFVAASSTLTLNGVPSSLVTAAIAPPVNITFQDQATDTNNYSGYSVIYPSPAGTLITTTPINASAGSWVYILDRGAFDYNRPEPRSTTVMAGNYNFFDNTVDSDPTWDNWNTTKSIYADYTSTAPAYWPNWLRFPITDPNGSTLVTMNPAMARYWGVTGPSGGGGITGSGGIANGAILINGKAILQ